MDEEVAVENVIGAWDQGQKLIDFATQPTGQGAVDFGEEEVEFGGAQPGAERARGEWKMFVNAGDLSWSEGLSEEVDDSLADEVIADVVVDGGDEADLGGPGERWRFWRASWGAGLRAWWAGGLRRVDEAG